MTSNTARKIIFNGNCGNDIKVDHNTILNGEGFDNIKSRQKKSEEQFESKNLKCKY